MSSELGMAPVLAARLRTLESRPPQTRFRAEVWAAQDDRLFVRGGDLLGLDEYLRVRAGVFARLRVGPRSSAEYSSGPRAVRRAVVPLAVAQWRAWFVGRFLSAIGGS